MARFIKLALTDLNDDGEPLDSVSDSWINLDQVIEIVTMLGNNLARRHSLGGKIEAEYYPLVQLQFTATDSRLVSLGTFPEPASGLAATEAFMPTLLEPAHSSNLDTEFSRLLGDTNK